MSKSKDITLDCGAVFPRGIKSKYKITTIKLCSGEKEDIIEFKNGKGHAYPYSKNFVGIWLNTMKPNRTIATLNKKFPKIDLQIKQVGDTEIGFLVPSENIKRILTFLKAKVKRKALKPDDPRIAILKAGREKLKLQRLENNRV